MNFRIFAWPMLAGAVMAFCMPAPSQAAMPAGQATASAEQGVVVEVAKKTRKRETRQQELDRSIDQGTVPSRYRRDVPKQYQQYIPFERR